MLDIKFVRDNPDAVKENIKKKFQDAKLPLVDEVIEKDAKYRECLKEVESLKAARNKLSKANGPLFGQLKKCTDEAQKAQLQAQIDANNAAVKADADKMAELEAEEAKLADRIQEIMYTIPQMIDPSVPIGPDDQIVRFIHQKQIVLLISLRKIAFQSGIRIKYIVIITDNAVCPAADVQTEFKGADLVFLCICKDRFPGNPLLFLYDLINSVIDPVKMSLCPWARNWIAVRFFQDTQLFFCSNGHSTEIQVFPLP